MDSTGVGDPIVERLQRLGGSHVRSLHFSATTKQQLMEGLAIAIHEGRVRVPEGPILAELETFEYVYTRTGVQYAAPPGMHDDCVCALALAVRQHGHCVNTVPCEILGPVNPDDSDGDDWLTRTVMREGSWFPGD